MSAYVTSGITEEVELFMPAAHANSATSHSNLKGPLSCNNITPTQQKAHLMMPQKARSENRPPVFAVESWTGLILPSKSPPWWVKGKRPIPCYDFDHPPETAKITTTNGDSDNSGFQGSGSMRRIISCTSASVGSGSPQSLGRPGCVAFLRIPSKISKKGSQTLHETLESSPMPGGVLLHVTHSVLCQ